MERYKEYKSSKVYWINEIPRSWQQIKISRIFHSIGSGTTPSSGDNAFYIEEGWNWLQSGDFKDNFVYDTSKKISEEAIKKYGLKLYPENAIVIAMYGASIGKVGFLKIKTTVNQACCVLYDSPIMNMHYAFYSLISEKNNLVRKSKGGTQPNISQELIKGHYLAVPPLAEQEKIVSYLENKTSKIDAYVADKEKEIELLQELKQKTIADAVTKGLNPDAKMKDSGISWIGEIPEHWEVTKIGSLFSERREKVSDKDYPALSVSKQGITPQLETAVKTDNGDNRKKVCIGDFVVNSRSDRKGSCGVSPYTGSVSLINIVLQPRTNIEGQYYHYLFRSNNYIEEYYRLGRGIVADLWTTRFSEMRNIMIPFPPLDEQRAIVAYINEKTAKVESLITDLQAEIEHLKEYKQRLIADCVTGQVNVQNETI